MFAQVIDYYCKIHSYKEALEAIQAMNERKIPLNPFLDQETIQLIYTSNGIEYQKQASTTKASEEIGEEIHEEVNQ